MRGVPAARKEKKGSGLPGGIRLRWVAGLLVFFVLGALALLVLRDAPTRVEQALYPLDYEGTIRSAAEEYGVEPAFVAGMIYAESKFRPEAESSQNAYGLMQLLPQTAEFVSSRSGIEGDYQDPRTNIRMGAWYLSYLSRKYDGDERLVIAAYNSGEGTVDGWRSREDFNIEDDIPYPETRNHVERVLEAREVYENLYGEDLRRNPG